MEANFGRHFLVSYEGGIADGKYDGEGELEYQNGNRYNGQLQGGKMNGEGRLKWVDGIVYQGQIVENVINGIGEYTWPDGSAYKGSTLQGKREGYGVYTKRAIRYEGEWHAGLKHGQGICYYNEEQTSYYTGDWVKGKKHGWGIMMYESGNQYEGEWKDNVRCGEGQMTWVTEQATTNELLLTCTLKSKANGSIRSASQPPTEAEWGLASQQLGHKARHERYIGSWKDGKPHGYGVYEWLSIPKEPGAKQNISEAPYQAENVYKGMFHEGKKHGEGVCYYADGSVFEGTWVNDKKHGEGLRRYIDGSADSIVFERDMIQSVASLKSRGPLPAADPTKWAVPRVDPLVDPQNSQGPTVMSVDNLPVDFTQFVENEKEAKEIKALLQRMFAHLRYIYKFYAKLYIPTLPQPPQMEVFDMPVPPPGPVLPPFSSAFQHPFIFPIPEEPEDVKIEQPDFEDGTDSVAEGSQAASEAPASPSHTSEVPEDPAPSPSPPPEAEQAEASNPPPATLPYGLKDPLEIGAPPVVSQCLTLSQFWEFVRDSHLTSRDFTLAKINQIILPALQRQTYSRDDDPSEEIRPATPQGSSLVGDVEAAVVQGEPITVLKTKQIDPKPKDPIKSVPLDAAQANAAATAGPVQGRPPKGASKDDGSSPAKEKPEKKGAKSKAAEKNVDSSPKAEPAAKPPPKGKGKKPKATETPPPEVPEEPQIPSTQHHEPTLDPEATIVAKSQAKRQNPHEGGTQLLFPTFVECLVRLAHYKYHYTDGHIWSSEVEQTKLLQSLQRLFERHVCFVTDSIKLLAQANIPGLVPFTGEPLANISNEATKSSRKAKNAKRRATRPGTGGTTASASSEYQSTAQSPMGATTNFGSTVGTLRGSVSGPGGMGPPNTSGGPQTANGPMTMNTAGTYSSMYSGTGTGGYGSGFNTTGGPTTAGGYTTVTAGSPQTARNAQLEEAFAAALSVPSVRTTSVTTVSIPLDDYQPERPDAPSANLTLVLGEETDTPAQVDSVAISPRPLTKSHKLYVQHVMNPLAPISMTFLGLELQYKGIQRPGTACTDRSTFQPPPPMVRQQLKTPPVLDLLMQRSNVLLSVWRKYKSTRSPLCMPLRLFLKFLTDYLLIGTDDEPDKLEPKKPAKKKASPRPLLAVDNALPVPATNAPDSRTNSANSRAGAGRPAPSMEGEEVKQAQPAPAPKPRAPRADPSPVDESFLRKPQVSSLMMRIVEQVFEEDVAARILENEDYTDADPRPPTPEPEPEMLLETIPPTPGMSSVAGESVATSMDWDEGQPESRALSAAPRSSRPGTGATSVPATRPTTSGTSGANMTEATPSIRSSQRVSPEEPFPVQEEAEAEAVPEPEPEKPKGPSALELKRAAALRNRMENLCMTWDYVYADLEMLYPQFVEAMCIAADSLFPRALPSAPQPISIHSTPYHANLVDYDVVPIDSPSAPSTKALSPVPEPAGDANSLSVTALRDRLKAFLDWVENPPLRQRPRTPSPPMVYIPPPLPRKKAKVVDAADGKGKKGKDGKPAAAKKK